jgi:hypothetical protein
MEPLAAELFRSDPRVIEARRLFLEALDDNRRRLLGVRPPQSGRKIQYQELVKAFGNLRGRELFFPYIGSGLGNGSLVELADGSVKYDFISGMGVHYFGHSFIPRRKCFVIGNFRS